MKEFNPGIFRNTNEKKPEGARRRGSSGCSLSAATSGMDPDPARSSSHYRWPACQNEHWLARRLILRVTPNLRFSSFRKANCTCFQI